ncbi:MAG: Rieske 2Fe-2S domain-containing protein [Saprospiraceae bacterium]|nr:Rieske 2Fe-2S domain-containing protein [Saprospiraceae bacterium]
MKNLSIAENIAAAQTLPTHFYTEESFFEQSKEKIFERTWHFAGDTEGLRLAENLMPHTILPNFIDEPVLFSRTQTGSLHCLSNVCTHRGNILVDHTCTSNQIRCRYHGRRFRLDGQFFHQPEFDGVENFPSEKDNLPHVPFGVWDDKLLFAGIKPTFSLDDFIGDMKKRLGWLPLSNFKFDATRSRDYLVKSHWALYVENYLEGFHIPFVHGSLNAVLDYGSYKSEIYRFANLQLGFAKSGEDAFDLPKESPEYGQHVAAYYYWVFPNMMFNFYPWGLSVNVVKPLSTSMTKVSFLCYVWDESKLGTGAGADLDKVEREDEAVVEAVQKGIRSRFYESGRYSAKREQGVHHFHRLIAEFMLP